jgi:hypothetical protein
MTDDRLESLLQRHRPAGPGPALRARIARSSRSRSQWAFLESMVALLLIGMNLAQIGASVTHLFPAPVADPARPRQIALALSALDLGLSPEQTQVMAQQLAAGAHLTPLPLIHSSASDNRLAGGTP